jgi:hypothetical protein
VDGDQDLVTFAVNSNGVVEVLELVVRSKLNINVLGNTGRNHSFLIVLDSEVGGLRRQNM